MQNVHFHALIERQRRFFQEGATLPITFRIEQLKKLKTMLKRYEDDIAEALKKDLNKTKIEAVVSEVFLVLNEIDIAIKNLKTWTGVRKVPTPFPLLWPGRSTIHIEPYGVVFIIGAWNYPFMLVLLPLVGAISAGNCAIIKPAHLATHSEALIVRLIQDHFPADHIAAVKGGKEEVETLLKEKFDYIFFTGSTQIGKMVMQAAAEQLTPITLELGGKSPCIVDKTADLHYAAKRIAWAKTTNAGQVCIAPDYLYVHHSCKTALISQLKEAFYQFYGSNPEKSTSYGRIINKYHVDRITKLLKHGNIISGGLTNRDALYIAPTLVDGISWDDPIMQEEIFGPILPILTFDNLDEVIHAIKLHAKPLALYLFTQQKENEADILRQISFGGGCINDCILHTANHHLPFGGIGTSGMGRYHGRYSFETFSHCKSIYKKTILFDFKFIYPPYHTKKLGWLRWLLRW